MSSELQRVRDGVWHWQSPHPDWNERQSWAQHVSSYVIDTGDRLLVIDPLAVPHEVEELVAGRPTVIVLTCPWHRRDAVELAARWDVGIHVPPPDGPDPDPVPGAVFEAGDVLDIGVEARPGLEPNDLVLWVPSVAALVTGDTLVDFGDGPVFPTSWADKGVDAGELFAGLQPLLELPVELVLPTHGVPGDRATLERALAELP